VQFLAKIVTDGYDSVLRRSLILANLNIIFLFLQAIKVYEPAISRHRANSLAQFVKLYTSYLVTNTERLGDRVNCVHPILRRDRIVMDENCLARVISTKVCQD